MQNPLVSVVIPTHNRKNKVIRLINSITDSTYKPLEIIIIDDASTDGTGEEIYKIFPHRRDIRIIRNRKNLYAAGSRNVGIQNANGKYLFFIDDDNVLDKNAIGFLVKSFQEDSRIGELGLVNRSFKNNNTVFWIRTFRNMWTTKTFLPNNLQDYRNTPIWDTVDVPNAFIVRADVIKRNNISFCPKFGIMYEESDVAYRIRKAGYTIKVVRDAVIYHDVDNSMQHFMNDMRMPFVFARNRVIFHSLYSNTIQLATILIFWIWIFMLFYWSQVLSYPDKTASLRRRLTLMTEYLKGVIAGLYFVFSGEKLEYPTIS